MEVVRDSPQRRFARATGQIDALRLEIQPRVSALSSIAEFVEEFGLTNGVPDGAIFLVNLEIDELLTNYVTHSLHKVQQPRIEVTLRLFPTKLVLELVDTGPPFDPFQVAPVDVSTPSEERSAGGLGLYLVRAYADKMDYTCIDNCNCVVLEHNLVLETEDDANKGS